MTAEEKPPQPLKTALLEHRCGQGDHYDWLLEDPAIEDGIEHGLWAGRIEYPSVQWREQGQWEVTALPYHRRVYLTYEGKISGGRGRVQRVDEGQFTVEQWKNGVMRLNIKMRGFAGRLELGQIDGSTWMAKVLD